MAMLGKGCKSCAWYQQNICMGRPSHIGCESRMTPKKVEKLTKEHNISYQELSDRIKNGVILL